MPLSLANLVRVLPETFPDSGRSTLCNAKVVQITDNTVDFLSLPDEFNPDTFSFSLDADEAATLTVITQEEVEAASTIWHRQYVAFADPSSGCWLHGQVNGLAYPAMPQIRVATTAGVRTVLLGDDDAPVMTVFPVVAILLQKTRIQANVAGVSDVNRRARLALPAGGTMTALELTNLHHLLYSRVAAEEVDTADSINDLHEVVPNIPNMLQGLVAIEEIPSPGVVCAIANPYTGCLNMSTILHVVLQVFYVGRDLPAELVGSVGQRFCEDPRTPQPENVVIVPRAQRHGQTPTAAVAITTDVQASATDVAVPTSQSTITPPDTVTLPQGYLSPRLRPQIAEVETTPQPFHLRIGATAPAPTATFRPSTEAPLAQVPLSLSPLPRTFAQRATQQPPAAPVAAVDHHLQFDKAQLQQFMTQPPPTVLAGFASYRATEDDLLQASLDHAQAFMASHRHKQRKILSLTLEEAWEAYDYINKDVKLFKVTQDEFEFHWWLSSQEFRTKTPNQFLNDCMARFPAFSITPHPAVLMFHYRLAFGSGQLSLWHFRKTSSSQLETWNAKDPISLTVFPAKSTPPVAQSFDTITELRDALSNIHKVACFYGSATYQQFTHAAKHFLDQGLDQADLTDADAKDLLRWFNLQFQSFSAALYLDIQQHRVPPQHIVAFHCFDTTSSRYSDLLLKLQIQRTSRMTTAIQAQVAEQVASAMGSSVPRHVVHQRNQPSGFRNPSQGNNVPGPMPPATMRAVPKHDGLPCCLRALTTRGCVARVTNGRCGSGALQKAHFVPSNLPGPVKSWMINEKKWTLRPEHSNL